MIESVPLLGTNSSISTSPGSRDKCASFPIVGAAFIKSAVDNVGVDSGNLRKLIDLSGDLLRMLSGVTSCALTDRCRRRSGHKSHTSSNVAPRCDLLTN